NSAAQQPTSVMPSMPGQRQSPAQDTIRCWSTSLIYGTSGFQRYLGAQFASNLVVFENVRYGNALYVMYERWEDLSKKSRLELLSGPARGFERILHRQGWEGKLRYAVNSRRGEAE
ncbi:MULTISPECIES: hypothetical protein, partial [unclassified Streptomyces]|uniref:hypothetical protein n=1 Tax=unclassified Streptomyces TaxID=2593676 RepID=UPI0035D85881